ncbi:MAG: polysaccharide deacetylase family protein [candidate division Zixibacteria bacterium]|nr:polysaccharide deacetylase family protein [candidate division Zixibacteria bacterium]
MNKPKSDEHKIRIPILCYHYFGIDQSTQPGIKDEDRAYITTQALFEEHLKFLKVNGCTAVSFSQIEQYGKGAGALPAGPVILTIDDGHKSVLEIAAPLLKQHDWPAELFVIPTRVGKTGYLTWEELAILNRAGISSQSHGLTHRLLNRLSRSEIGNELSESKKCIEENLESRVSAFAVPMGGYPFCLQDIARDAGYSFLCTSYYGLAEPLNRPYRLARLMIKSPDDSIGGLESMLKPSAAMSIKFHSKTLLKRLKNHAIGLLASLAYDLITRK